MCLYIHKICEKFSSVLMVRSGCKRLPKLLLLRENLAGWFNFGVGVIWHDTRVKGIVYQYEPTSIPVIILII